MSNPPIKPTIVESSAALAALDRGDFLTPQKYLEDLLAWSLDSAANASFRLGQLSSLQVKHDEAIAHLERAIELDPVNQEYREMLAKVKLEAEEFKKYKKD